MSSEMKEPVAVIGLKRSHYTIYLILIYIGVLVIHFMQLNFHWSPWLQLLYLFPILSVMLVIIGPGIRYHQTSYRIHPVMIGVVRGLYTRRLTIVPIDRIQSVKVTHGPLADKYGLAKLTITTSGNEYKLPYMTRQQADVLSRQIIERIKEVLNYV